MSQFIFVVEVPPNTAQMSPAGYPPEWTLFENDVSPKPGSSGNTKASAKVATRLQRNAWLLPAETSWPFLSTLVASATFHRLSYSLVLVPDGAEVLALDVKPSR